jgi:hypothetical protein
MPYRLSKDGHICLFNCPRGILPWISVKPGSLKALAVGLLFSRLLVPQAKLEAARCMVVEPLRISRPPRNALSNWSHRCKRQGQPNAKSGVSALHHGRDTPATLPPTLLQRTTLKIAKCPCGIRIQSPFQKPETRHGKL